MACSLADEIRKAFTISKEILKDANDHLWSLVSSLGDDMAESARHNDVTFIGVHIRRGDKVRMVGTLRCFRRQWWAG